VSPTAISAAVPRRRTTMAGRVVRVTAFTRPWVRLDVEFSDGTGTAVLRFVGRSEIPGMLPGRSLEVEGTLAMEHGTLIILNPLYEFVA
jgi:hypothetical protein